MNAQYQLDQKSFVLGAKMSSSEAAAAGGIKFPFHFNMRSPFPHRHL